MLYGALPDTGIGQLSLPHQKPGGPSPAAAATALVSTSARAAVMTSHDRFAMASHDHPLAIPRLMTPPR
jgi:hypothetical protein